MGYDLERLVSGSVSGVCAALGSCSLPAPLTALGVAALPTAALRHALRPLTLLLLQLLQGFDVKY